MWLVRWVVGWFPFTTGKTYIDTLSKVWEFILFILVIRESLHGKGYDQRNKLLEKINYEGMSRPVGSSVKIEHFLGPLLAL